MVFNQIIYSIIIPSAIAITTSGLVAYFSNKKLDVHKRTMEIRKNLYSISMSLLNKFISIVSEEESNKTREKLLNNYREIQIWGSDGVVRSFNKLICAMDLKNNISQKARNHLYKEFIIAIREDILGGTNLSPSEIDIRGIVDYKNDSTSRKKS